MSKQDKKPTKETKSKTKKASGDSINWQFIPRKHNFSGKWYVGMFLGFLILLALAIFLIKSWSFVVLLLVSVLALAVFIRRPNKPIHYSLTPDEISIDGISRPFDDFKSFGVATNLDGTFKIVFTPTKRLAPALEVDINTEDGEKIVDFLGVRLPMKEVELNFIDQIVQRLGL